MQPKIDSPRQQPDRRLWERVSTAYRSAAGISATALTGSNDRTEAARETAEDRARSTMGSALPVDLYIDPICPYTWLAACWLRMIEQHRDMDLQYHPMSLSMLNEQRTMDPGYEAHLKVAVGPSRIGTAVWLHHGPEDFRAWHTSFGSIIFDRWRYPSRNQYRSAAARALEVNGLPESLVRAENTDEYDAPLWESHLQGTVPVGVDGGTPVIHFAGVAYFGPVLNAIPTTDEALDLFDGLTLLAGCRDFFEIKRSRTAPPTFAESGPDPLQQFVRGDRA